MVDPTFDWKVEKLPGHPPVVEITVSGYFSLANLQGLYGKTLSYQLQSIIGPFALLFSAQGLTGIELSMPKAHAELLLGHLDRIVAIATVSSRAFVRFGMASASLVLNRKFHTFNSREEALAWLRMPGESAGRPRAG
jgi:hypothetical protein